MATNPSTLPENVGRITAPDANYPYGSAKNDSTGTAGDGTPFIAPLLNDWYGFSQALLTRAGIAPSGAAETALVSQLADAVQSIGGSLDTTRIDVASAANINLTSAAPNTRHINITGTTTITGFTVAAGRCYFVRFNAALTLTNSASLVTQRGADIVTAAGDTCIIRATATNVVEVICFARGGISQSLAANGYRIFDGGYAIQQGSKALAGTSTTAETYPLAFTEVYQVVAVRSLAGTANTASLNITGESNTGFSYVNTGNVACTGRYIAVGRIAL